MIPDTQILILSQINDGCFINPQHILIGPGMAYKPLPEAAVQPFIMPRLAILHTNGGENSATALQLWLYANAPEVVIEPHVDVNLDGTALQFMPLNRRADCNSQANRFYLPDGTGPFGAIAHETQDRGSKFAPINDQPWELPQLITLIRMLTAECATYGIRCTIPTWYKDSGIGYHSQYPEWSNSMHSCPGNARIRQMPYLWNEVSRRLAAFYGATGGNCP